MTKNKYQLVTGKAGEKQLDGLDKFFGENSRKFLQDIGLKVGMQIADVGCGIGNLSLWLAEQTGPDGHVCAIDSSAEQLESAKQRAQQRGITNISFHELDVHDLSKFDNHFDLTYCRWLLVHLQDPVVAVNSMAKTVRSNGILACEVGDMHTNEYYPHFAAYAALIEKLIASLKQSGCDIDISFNIFKIFKSLVDFPNVNIRLSQDVISDIDTVKLFRSQSCVMLDSISTSLVENKLMSKEDIEALKKEVQSHPIDDNTLLFLSRMTQIWSQRVV